MKQQLMRSALVVLALVAAPALQLQAQRESATVLRIMDGETLKIERNGQKELIRLIGIDTPKSKMHQKAERIAMQSKQDFLPMTSPAIEAMQYLKHLVKSGDTVVIEFDVETRDKTGLLLGYVFLSDGRMLNKEILKAGYAYLVTSAPNVKHQEELLQARHEAWRHARGVWKKKATRRSR
jgi:micrococcal nuclease